MVGREKSLFMPNKWCVLFYWLLVYLDIPGVFGKNERKRLVEEVLSQGTKVRGKQPTKMNNVSRRKPVRKVHLEWFHFNEATQTYVQVKTHKTGGTCTQVAELLQIATREGIVNTGIRCYFPNGTSTFGSSD